ncbi:MAG TPA: tetratricopeptide repeat protein [Xanthobacteraceae bacterium]|nr:tetratricopeptide repeat protein [Xanthobacteraceae bacterium]
MPRMAAASCWLRARAGARSARRCLDGLRRLAAAAILIGLCWSAPSRAADAVKGEASFSTAGGFARLLLKLTEDVASEVTTAGSIIVIRFERPVNVPVDRLPEGAPDYISSARRDPDGMAIRLSLARRVTVNTMSAGERTFVDLMPDGWSGAPPGLPIEVVRELAERARAAERALRQQRSEAQAKKRPPIRVRALVQPTFVRFVFEMPDGVGASSVLNDKKLTLSFNALLTFDMADAKIAAPPNIASINQRVEGDTTLVDITLIGDVDVHPFREDRNYIIDVAFQQAEKPKAPALSAEAPHAAGEKPKAPGTPAAAEKHVKEQMREPAAHSEEIVPPTSETIAQQMKMGAKPDQAMKQAAEPEAQKSPSSEPPAQPAAAETAAAERPSAGPPAKETPKEAPMAAVPQSESKPTEAKPAESKSAETKSAEAGSLETTGTTVEAVRDSDGLRLKFSFAGPTPAASFRRGDAIWLVFDSKKSLDVEPIRAKAGTMIGDVSRFPLEKGQAIRIRLNRPLLHSLASDDRGKGTAWTLALAEKMQAPPQPLMVLRNITDPALANIVVPLANPGLLHRLLDPDVGDTLLVVTAPPPVRGFIKRQDFVDFALLDSAHGIAMRPNSDEVAVELAPDKVLVGKPGGLTLSSVDAAAERAPTAVRPVFDVEEWRKNQGAPFIARQDALINAAAAAEPEQRALARLNLARFYMARGMYPEAKGVAEMLLADPGPKVEEFAGLMVHAIASILINRPEVALKDLASPAIGNNYDSQLWQGLAFARQAKWVDAREKFKNVEFAIASLPLDLQRIVTADAMHASLEVKDYAGASKRRAELDVIGVPDGMKPAISVLRGRLSEVLGHDRDALDEYKFAINSADRGAAAEAKLFEMALRQKRDEISQAEALRDLEILAVTWRGDGIEVKTLGMLSKIYSDSGRYAEALLAARTATKLQPNSEASRQAQDLASALFSQVFLGPTGDNMPPVDALAMFYEFRELTPIGRRGDEMIRRLADRLVAVDLLDQAAELLQYQIDRRLEGSARAQVAAKLAMIYLMNRKPDLAISALRSSRIADLSGELRQQRLLLEARAQSDIGRHDLAVDIISNIAGREAIRLRSDIYWAARRWRESAEQIELYYGERWRDFKPLNSIEKGDVIRAAVGYALAEDSIGLARFREKYAPLMSGEADKLAFDVASKPAGASSSEFAAIAKMAASVDTLDGFLREMKTRFPDAATRAAPDSAKTDPEPTGALPRIIGVKRAEAGR